jgi:flagellar basal-body rod protein FlgC
MLSIFNTLNISASGLTAERLRMDVTSNNIANANTTLSVDGTPFKRKSVILAEKASGNFSMDLNSSIQDKGVEVAAIVEDNRPPVLRYDPSSPNANEEGYVVMPNVNILNEMVDMISATRAYEANATAIEATKSMIKKTLEI